MHQCVLAKFVQHKDLREQLLATGTEDIVEDSDIDAWWGRGPDNNGLNNLGRILMHVRELLKGE
jgi:ribA/ribD-fused uncharacterized protein